VRLLKLLCQTERRKHLAWHTGAAAFEREGIPRQFTTTSRVIIIANDWQTLNRNVAAVQDRGHVLYFTPTAAEVHRQIATWFGDDAILRWFEQLLPSIGQPSMRHYIRAAELKRAGMEWQTAIPVSEDGNVRALLVAELQADVSFPNEEARATEFTRRGAGCRATYFNWSRRLKRAA